MSSEPSAHAVGRAAPNSRNTQFGRETRGDRRIAVASSIVQDLAVHARVEEELFYPLALDSLDEKGRGLIWEATVEHGTLSGLIEALGGADADDEKRC